MIEIGTTRIALTGSETYSIYFPSTNNRKNFVDNQMERLNVKEEEEEAVL